ncbi:MAG: cysteine dioxygenase family protein [Candidatus Eremiobacteraeota bacterium]|nr:cysteine dioxygenase family protein [Candidatus Eremiobacteraeota bacterium]
MHAFLDHLRRLTAADATDERFVRALLDVTPHIPTFAAFDAPATKSGYRRTLLHREKAFELVAMRWNGGIETSVHDHGGQRCWFVVMDGTIGVENFRRVCGPPGDVSVRSQGSALLFEGEVDARLTDADLHRCLVPGEGALTLHLYANPLGEYNVYDLTAHSITKQRSSYDDRCLLSNERFSG